MTPLEAYTKLEAQEARAASLSGAMSVLHWDKAVIMPKGGAYARAAQMTELCLMVHEVKTDPARADLIALAEQASDDLDGWQQANLKEIGRDYVRATALEPDLVKRLSQSRAGVEMAWRVVREEDDFAAIAAPLQGLIDLAGEEAACLGDALDLDPYDALLDGFEPGLRAGTVETLFSKLNIVLPDLLDDIIVAQATGPQPAQINGPFPVAEQKGMSLAIMTDLGFDFDHGRLDESHHPFTGGVPGDVRITTRYQEGDFFQALMGTIHETGHALYEAGLPEIWRGQPVGQARGMVMHESQSLLFEMQAGRSPAYIDYLGAMARKHFNRDGPEWCGATFRRAYHHVEKGLVRVFADEVSYPLHVMLRFELERALLSGNLKAADLPGAWNNGMDRLLGVRPDNDRDGCLQDIHWYSGAFGYFPTYTLGALAAAQIYAAAQAALPTLEDDLGRGRAATLLDWLQENIHTKASRFSTKELLVQATGQELGTEPFLRHLKNRYLDG